MLVIIATTVAVFDLLTPPKSSQPSTSLPFIQQPVVDVIIPSLFRTQGSNNDNMPLNLTQGESMSLTVDVYTTVSLNLKFEFQVLSYVGQSSNGSSSVTEGNSSIVSVAFNPSSLAINGANKGTTNMTVTFSDYAGIGQYNSVVSVVNMNNSTQVWGDLIQINIAK